MNNDVHERAQRLIIEGQVEGISPADREWLSLHLEACEQCAKLADSTDRTLRLFRSVSVAVDPALIRATRLRMHARALELAERRTRMTLLWVSCALSWVLGAVSAPWVWRGFAWLGGRAGMPAITWQLGFALWWTLPAAAVAVVLAVRRMQAEGREESEDRTP